MTESVAVLVRRAVERELTILERAAMRGAVDTRVTRAARRHR